MVTDQQVKKLLQFRKKGNSISLSALKSGMTEKTARKYIQTGLLYPAYDVDASAGYSGPRN